MQSRMIPSSRVFKDLSVFGHVLYATDSTADYPVMLHVYEFKYFEFKNGVDTVVPRISPSSEASFLFEYRHMRITRTLYEMESYWASDAHCKNGGLLCWMHFPRQTAKRKRFDNDLRMTERNIACNMCDAGRPIEMNLLTGETRLYRVVNAFFPSDTPIEPKTGFAILAPIAVVPHSNVPRI
jgi:hypothetical protein